MTWCRCRRRSCLWFGVLGCDDVDARKGVTRLHDGLLLGHDRVHQPLPQLEVRKRKTFPIIDDNDDDAIVCVLIGWVNSGSIVCIDRGRVDSPGSP